MKSTYLLSKYSVVILAVLFLAGCKSNQKTEEKKSPSTTQQVSIDNSLRDRLTEFASKPRTKGQFAFYVYDLTAGKPVYAYNEHTALPVASCLKLLSGVAGLHLLGTQYMYNTYLFTRGHLENGTLHGDIAIKAELDPQLNEPDLRMFAKVLREKGIRKLDGHCVLDLLLTDPVKSEPHWYPWDLSFSRYGILYKGAPKVTKEMKAALRSEGIAVTDSQVTTGRVPRGSHCILRYQRPIEPVIKRMWKNSSNTQATSLLYTIGHHVNPSKLPTDAGVAYLRKFLKDNIGQKDTALVIHDGCGLCTHNHLSPLALTAVLRYAYNHKPIYRMLNRQLSVSGVDGTLHREISDPAIRGRIHGKTGTLSHPYGISSLAGYCKGTNGHVLAFAVIGSEMSVLDAHVLQQRLCKILCLSPKPLSASTKTGRAH